MKTFFCWIPKLGGDRATGIGGLYRAENRGKARYECYLTARECSYDVTFADIKVVRERALDAAQFNQGSMPKYARRPL